MNFECTCRMVYGDNGPVGKTRSKSCEMHGSVEATAKYRAEVHSEIQASRFPRLPRPVGCQPMYIADDATVSLDDAGGTRPLVGFFAGTNDDGTVDVLVGDATFKFRHDDSAPEPDLTTLPAPQKILYKELPTGPSRANALADRCQTLEDEKRGLEVENSRLRREVERLGRKR